MSDEDKTAPGEAAAEVRGTKRPLEDEEEGRGVNSFEWYCFATVSMRPLQCSDDKERLFFTGLCNNEADLLEASKLNAREWIDANRGNFDPDWFMLSTNFNTMNDIMSAFGRYAHENASECIFALVWATGQDINLDGLDTKSFIGRLHNQNNS